jgi:pentatricopeptide repeat protein
MVFKPFTHIARQSFTKAFTHGYAQSVVAASQSSYASSTTLNHLTAANPAKFSRTTQLQHVFQPSSSSGAGAKASQGSSGGGDVGLAAYYAAWQQAQQTGDDSDWKQLQLKRKLGWKPTAEEEAALKQNPADSVPSNARSDLNNGSPHLTKASANADVSAKVEEAVAREIQIQEEQAQAEEASESQDASATEAFPDLPEDVAAVGDIATEESRLASEHIVQLASSKKFAEIPGAFAAILRDGLTPTVGAYNALLDSAIELHDDRSQAIPKALDVYSDMLRRRVIPDEQTYQMLVQLFVMRTHDAMKAMEVLEQERVRFGGMEEPGKFMLHSSELEQTILAEDDSLGIAMKLFSTATSRHADLVFPLDVYRHLITACANAGKVEAMIRVYGHMESHKVTPHASIFPSMIDAFAAAGDLTSAVECYNEYRSLAVSDDSGTFCIIQRRDGQVYASLIKAYMSCGKEENAMRFLERIRSSFDEVTENRETRQEALESVIIHDALVQHALKSGDHERALEQAKTRLHDGALNQAMSQICIAAADSGNLKIASEAYDLLPKDVETRKEPAVSILALHVREGNVSAARSLWLMLSTVGQATSDMVQPTVMYAVALLKSGRTDESLVEARNMFARIRNGSSSNSVREHINESIHLLSRVLVQGASVLSPQASMSLLWLMIENGGLIAPVAEHAVAFLGPLEISQLNPRDLALALQVQASILVSNSAMSFDAAHPIRFSHMLDIALANGLAMDSATVSLVDQAVNKLFTSRPDMVSRWHSYLGLTSSPSTYLSGPHTPVSELSSMSSAPSEDSFDPYAYATDFKGSAMIAEELESTHGRPESHLNESLNRLRNMRRAGRHPRYITYAKLIGAAAKNNRTDLVHEILSMARRDVPLLPQYKAVKYGWTSILDAMVAACLTLGDRGLASKYHNELSELGSAPSANTFGLYITTLKESTKTFDEATEALKIFHRAVAEGVEPTSFLYNALIGKLGKARRIDDCLQYFAEMRANNVRPTSVTYGTIVNALCRVSDERFAEEMFEEMESMPNYKPRPAPYNSMIQYFLNTKRDRSKVLAYYERMLSRNIRPTMHTYKLLIDAHASLEPVDMPAAEKVLETIKASRQEPEAVHYASLIHAKGCVMRDMESALKVFTSAVSNPKVHVQPCLYQALLESMVANHQVAQTESIVDDMAKRRVEMTAYIANTLIHGWAAEGNLQKASAIYNSIGIDKREPSTYEAMTRAYLAADDHASASRTVQEMLSRGYPSAVAHKIADLVSNGAVTATL